MRTLKFMFNATQKKYANKRERPIELKVIYKERE